MSEGSGESIIGKFFGVLGFKVDHHGVNEFKESLEHVKHAVEGLLMIELGERIYEFVERSIGAAAAVNDFAEVTEMTAEKVDALGRVAIEHSSNLDAMKGAIMGVYRATGQAALGIGRNVKLFQTLGIHAKDSSGHVKSAETVMEELADKFQSMDMAKVIGTAGRLGIDPMIAKAMKEMGAEGWRKEVGEAMSKGLLSNHDYEQADKTEKTFKRLHLVLGQITSLVANQLAPWVRKAVDAFEKFVIQNKIAFVNKLHAAMKFLSDVLSTLWSWGERIFDVMGRLYSRMDASRKAGEAFRLVLIAIAAVETAQVIGKVADAVNNLWKAFTAILKVLGLMSLLVVAVGLLLEDWLAFQRGEESLIGDLQTKWPAAFKVIQTAMEGLLSVWNDIVAAAKALGLIKKDEAPKMSLARYNEYKNNPPKVGTPEAEEFLAMERMVKGGQHPFAQFAANLDRAHGVTGALSAAIMDKPGAVDRAAIGVGTVLADAENRTAAGGGITMNITGTKIAITADTDERARTAGDSVMDKLANGRVRNYQPRAF